MTSNVFPLILIRAAGLPFQATEPLRGDFSTVFNRLRYLRQQEEVLHEAVLQALTEALVALPESPLRTTVYNLRKAVFHRRTQAHKLTEQLLNDKLLPSSTTPLHTALTAWQRAISEKSDAEHDIRKAHDLLTHDGLLALQNLVTQNDTLRRALLFSSHDLLRALPDFAQKPIPDWGKKERAIALSVAEYLSRAVFKAVPLSRLGTVSVWRLPSTAERVEDRSDVDEVGLIIPKPIVTPNVQLLPLLYEVLLREPAFYRSLSVALNPSFQADNTWLYFDGERESFQHMAATRVTDWLVETLLKTGRKLPFTDLLTRLEQAVEASVENLQNLVFEWIDIGLLEWQLPERGLAPGWCSGLYQYLGFLPSAHVLTDAAFLLQWLRTAARVLPFQTVEAARDTQQEALEQVQAFFQKYDCPMPPLAVEQLFYEDVEQPMQANVPPEAMRQIIADLVECWQQQEAHPQPAFRAKLFSFAQTVLEPGAGMDFLTFCRQFLEYISPENMGTTPIFETPRYRGKIGAAVQVFQENGQYRAVVNGLFPGGGKLFARWLHLLPTDFREAVEAWNEAVPFGWQGWSNANFQPPLSKSTVSVPGGRTGPKPGGTALPLADFEVRLNNHGAPQLVHFQSGEALECSDFGLEAPETRPPAMQVLWHLTVPYVSLEMLLPSATGRSEEVWGWHSPRIIWKSLVLQRQRWELRTDVWKSWSAAIGPDADFFLLVRPVLREIEVPSRFFAHFPLLPLPPQQVDCDSPMMMRIFRKMLTQGKGPLVLTEMLPLPEQCVTSSRSSLRHSSFGIDSVLGSSSEPNKRANDEMTAMANDEMTNDKVRAAEFVLEFSTF